MNEIEQRLASALAGWARAEMELGFAHIMTGETGQFIYREMMIGGEQDYRCLATLESAARMLVQEFRRCLILDDRIPGRSTLVWRTFPEVAMLGDYAPAAKAYCRFCLIGDDRR